MSLKIKISVLCLMLFAFAHAQDDQSVQGVKISADKSEPHKNAILDVEVEPGVKKGLIMPRVTTPLNSNETDVEGDSFQEAIGADDEAEGMLVYKKADSETDTKEGVWYYDGQSFIRMSLPAGSIIMYSGALDGKFDANGVGIKEYHGWAICNGYNGGVQESDDRIQKINDQLVKDFLSRNGMTELPDLRGQFVVGTTDKSDLNTLDGEPQYTMGSNIDGNGNAGAKEVKLEAKNMPNHDHDVQATKVDAKEISLTATNVKAKIKNLNADLSFSTRQVDLKDHGDYVTQAAVQIGGGCDDCSNRRSIPVSGNADLDLSSLTFTGHNDSDSHDITIVSNKIFDNEPFENRPPFFVVAYIIKLK